MRGKKKSVPNNSPTESYKRRLARDLVLKGDAVVRGGETTLVFRDDGGRTSRARRLSAVRSRAFILKALGGNDDRDIGHDGSMDTTATYHRRAGRGYSRTSKVVKPK